MSNLSRRDFLNVGKILAAAIGVTAFDSRCAPKNGETQSGQETMIYTNHPLNSQNIEVSIRTGNVEVAEFGSCGASCDFRTITLLPNHFDEAQCYPIFPGILPTSEQKDEINRIKNIYNNAEKIILVQKRGPSGWETVTLPPSVSQLGISVDINNMLNDSLGVTDGEGNADTIQAKAILWGAFNSRGSTDQQAIDIVNQAISDPVINAKIKGYLPVIRSLYADIPENVSMELATDILRAGLKPVSGAKDFTLFSQVAQNAGIEGAIFVPKETAFDKGIKAWKELTIPLIAKPDIIFVERDTAFGGLTSKVLVRHQKDADKKNNGVLDFSGRCATAGKDIVTQWEERGCFDVLDPTSTEYQREVEYFKINTGETLLTGEVLRILKVRPDKMRSYLIPNKTVGLSQWTHGWGMPTFEDRYDSEGKKLATPEIKVMTFRPMMRDFFVGISATQSRDQFWTNWLVDYTEEANRLLSLGINEMSQIGAFSPLDSLSRFMMGYHDALQQNLFWMPSSPLVQARLLSYFYDLSVDDKNDPQLNLLTAVDDIQLFDLSAEQNPNWIHKLAQTVNKVLRKDVLPEIDTIKVAPTLDSNSVQALLKKGEMVPVSTLINIGGVEYVAVGQVMRDENKTQMAINEWDAHSESNFFNNFKNLLLGDSTTKVMVIKYEDALKKGLILDPDPNFIEAMAVIAKTLIVAGSLVYVVAAPVAAGAIVGTSVTATGMAVRNSIGKVFNFITGSILR